MLDETVSVLLVLTQILVEFGTKVFLFSRAEDILLTNKCFVF